MIIDRIRAHGGEAIRDRWRIRIRRGDLGPEAMAWVKEHRSDLMREVWPEYDDWEERSAIMEYCGEMSREDAEESAYAAVMGTPHV